MRPIELPTRTRARNLTPLLGALGCAAAIAIVGLVLIGHYEVVFYTPLAVMAVCAVIGFVEPRGRPS